MMNIPKSYDQLDQWTTVMFLYNSALKAINTKIEILNNEFIHIYNYNPIEHIKSRLKTPDSIVKKLKNDNCEVTISNMIECLSDIAGIRIICSFTSDIYLIADMIARQSDVTVLYVKDYIENPKSNGYKSYHMVVTIPIYLTEGPVETKVEIQIRTVAMDFWASLEHKIYYKFEGNAPDYLEAELKACADMVDMLDAKMFSLNEAIMEIGEEQKKQKEIKSLKIPDTGRKKKQVIKQTPK
ncbi:MAG: GTP pyrophosphokinase family protein [Clostridium sp.]